MRAAIYVPPIPDRNTTPLLGPLYLLALLEKEGIDGRLFDARIDSLAYHKLLKHSPSLVGVSAVTASYPGGVRAAGCVKRDLPGAMVVFGGPHVSALPESAALEQSIDFVFIGESEISFTQFAAALRGGSPSREDLLKIHNIAFEEEGRAVFSPQTAPFVDLDALPWPAFHRMDVDAYFKGAQAHGIFSRGKRILTMMSTRGCPSSCAFCCRVMGSKIRSRSVDSVMDEIRFLSDTYKIDELYFEDDNFTVNRKRALEILEKLASFNPPLHLKFANGIRADLVDAELLTAMKNARVYSLSFGIESGSPATIQKMNKKLDLGAAKESVALAKSMGFLVGANCIIGYPGESVSDVKTSLDYFFGLPLDSMAIVNLVPFPGTEARAACEKAGYLTKEAADWENYYFSVANPIILIDTPMLPAAEAAKLIRNAYRRMYLRPKWIFTALKNISFRNLISGFSILFGTAGKKRC